MLGNLHQPGNLQVFWTTYVDVFMRVVVQSIWMASVKACNICGLFSKIAWQQAPFRLTSTGDPCCCSNRNNSAEAAWKAIGRTAYLFSDQMFNRKSSLQVVHLKYNFQKSTEMHINIQQLNRTFK